MTSRVKQGIWGMTILGVTSVAAVWFLATQPPREVAGQDLKVGQIWEYKVVYVGQWQVPTPLGGDLATAGNTSAKRFTDEYNELGSAGWEYVAPAPGGMPLAVFKR